MKEANALSNPRCPVCKEDIPEQALQKHIQEAHPPVAIDQPVNLGMEKAGAPNNEDPLLTTGDTQCAECGHAARLHDDEPISYLGTRCQGPDCRCVNYAPTQGQQVVPPVVPMPAMISKAPGKPKAMNIGEGEEDDDRIGIPDPSKVPQPVKEPRPIPAPVKEPVKTGAQTQGPGICPTCGNNAVSTEGDHEACSNCGSWFTWWPEQHKYRVLKGPTRPLGLPTGAPPNKSAQDPIVEPVEREAAIRKELQVKTCINCDENAQFVAYVMKDATITATKELCREHTDIFKMAYAGVTYKVFALKQDAYPKAWQHKLAGECPSCGQAIRKEAFVDEFAEREFGISGLCFDCQNTKEAHYLEDEENHHGSGDHRHPTLDQWDAWPNPESYVPEELPWMPDRPYMRPYPGQEEEERKRLKPNHDETPRGM